MNALGELADLLVHTQRTGDQLAADNRALTTVLLDLHTRLADTEHVELVRQTMDAHGWRLDPMALEAYAHSPWGRKPPVSR